MRAWECCVSNAHFIPVLGYTLVTHNKWFQALNYTSINIRLSIFCLLVLKLVNFEFAEPFDYGFLCFTQFLINRKSKGSNKMCFNEMLTVLLNRGKQLKRWL